jgi:hypothetical protein
MPTSLDTIYDRILLNIKDPEVLISVGRTMNWLIFSSRPMALREIIDALAFDFNGEPLRFNMAERMRPKALLAACGGFVTLSKEDETDDAFSEEDAVAWLEDDAVASWPRLQLAHASVKDYFVCSRKFQGTCSEVPEQLAHRLIARTCMAYLCSLPALQNSADMEPYPLARYALQNWVFHLKLCDEIRCAKPREPRRQIMISVPYSPELMMFSLFVYFLLLLGLFGVSGRHRFVS